VTLNIESIDYEDIETLVRYGIHFWDLTPYKDQFEYNPDTVRDLVTHVADDHYLRVVRLDGEIVGFIGFLLHPFIFSNLVQQATEVFFYVHPSYRKDGVGEALLQRAEEDMKRIGVDIMALGDMTSSSDLDKAYRARGFGLSERTYHKAL